MSRVSDFPPPLTGSIQLKANNEVLKAARYDAEERCPVWSHCPCTYNTRLSVNSTRGKFAQNSKTHL
ncbi:hypothetical protein P8C59_005990 [Phyllachora maydis]|uniref:Uncharacterized protein n=1 Tax=Phyllachora maydis TaxID=1825666 RepID=A0AAD9MC25_9PEZI|nr:hypothetical protein P8C59_005990 [Phyllachora maydis]